MFRCLQNRFPVKLTVAKIKLGLAIESPYQASVHSQAIVMSDNSDTSKSRSGAQAQDPRRDRLKLALRENLKRRKAQARGRHDVATDGDAGPSRIDQGNT
jgi:hypothetical protein